MNKKGYTNKYGTRVGPYNRKVSRFPNTYTTYRMIDGKYRVCKITRKNGKEYIQVLDDQRKAKPITFAEAKKHFEELSERRQEADRRYRAKRTFTQTEITSSYLSKTGTSRYDVEALDTPKEKPKIKNKKGDFYQEFYKFDENQRETEKLKTEIAVLKHEINYTDEYMSYLFKKTDPTPKEREKIKQYEDMKAKLKEKETELKKIDYVWQKKPDKFYSSEIDPRYNKILKEKKLEYANVKASIQHCETELESGRLVEGGRLKENFKKRLANNLKWKERLEKELNELRKEPKSIYWGDKLIEATIEEGKRLPTDVRRSMPEKYKKEYKTMIEKQNIEKLKREKEAEKREKERIAKDKAKEQAIKEADRLLPEMQEKFSKNARTKLDKEIWKEQPISDFKGDMKGILDPSRITLLTTNEQMKHSNFGEQFEEHKKVDFEDNEMIMDSYGFQYEFNGMGECTFSQEYVDLAMKSMENPKVYYKKNTPLVIKDDTYTYIIAPRVTEEDIDYDDDLEPHVVDKKKDEFDPTIRISQLKYKDLMKSKKKDEMVKDIRKLEVKKEGYSKYDAKKKNKHEVLHDLLTLRKEI